MNRFNYRWLGLIAIGIAAAIGITFFSPFASSSPDGLERVAEDEGFIEEANDSSYDVIPDYQMPGIENERVATVIAGVVGVLIVAGLGFAIGYGPRLLGRDDPDEKDNGPLDSPGIGSEASG